MSAHRSLPVMGPPELRNHIRKPSYQLFDLTISLGTIRQALGLFCLCSPIWDSDGHLLHPAAPSAAWSEPSLSSSLGWLIHSVPKTGMVSSSLFNDEWFGHVAKVTKELWPISLWVPTA